MKIRLSEKDIEVLTFLSKYKMMLGTQCRGIYKSKGYHTKRLDSLVKHGYIQRYQYFYIKLDMKGIKLIRQLGYPYKARCRNKEYQERLKGIVKIAGLTIDSQIEFIPSWDLKIEGVYTDVARKYVGELNYSGNRMITYSIAKGKECVYIRQVINDIQKAINYKQVIIFVNNFDMINKQNHYFIFGKESVCIIRETKKNFELMKLFQKLDIYEILTEIYCDKEILLSNWKRADYMTDKNYIVFMPFMDTEKLHRISTFYKHNTTLQRKTDIITLRENIAKIQEIVTNEKVNIIELDEFLGGINEE